MTRYEQSVKQAHQGDNGVWFYAWTCSGTTDPIRAVLVANQSLYCGRELGKVVEVRLIDYWRR